MTNFCTTGDPLQEDWCSIAFTDKDDGSHPWHEHEKICRQCSEPDKKELHLHKLWEQKGMNDG